MGPFWHLTSFMDVFFTQGLPGQDGPLGLKGDKVSYETFPVCMYKIGTY